MFASVSCARLCLLHMSVSYACARLYLLCSPLSPIHACARLCLLHMSVSYACARLYLLCSPLSPIHACARLCLLTSPRTRQTQTVYEDPLKVPLYYFVGVIFIENSKIDLHLICIRTASQWRRRKHVMIGIRRTVAVPHASAPGNRMRCMRGSTRGATRLHKRNYY
jgi:hypothetical protein